MPVIYTTGEKERCLTFGLLPGEEIEDFRSKFGNTVAAVKDSIELYHTFSAKGNMKKAEAYGNRAQQLLEGLGAGELACRTIGAAMENVPGIAISCRTNYLPTDPNRPNAMPREYVDFQPHHIRNLKNLPTFPETTRKMITFNLE